MFALFFELRNEEIAEHDGAVVLGVARAVKQQNVAITRSFEERLPGVWIFA